MKKVGSDGCLSDTDWSQTETLSSESLQTPGPWLLCVWDTHDDYFFKDLSDASRDGSREVELVVDGWQVCGCESRYRPSETID